MADIFNKLLSNFCSSFTSIKKITDLTIHGTGMDTTIGNLKKYTKNDNKLYEREMDIMTPLWNVLGLQVPISLDKQIQRAENIKVCLDDLAKHRLILGSVFVGVGTAKFWKKMSTFCMNSIIVPLRNVQKMAETKMLKGIDDIQKRLSDNFNDMKSKNKDQHNKDAQAILDLWNNTIGSNGANITLAYQQVFPECFQSMYMTISTMVKSNSPLCKLVTNNGSNTTGNVYWDLFSAIKNVERNWNSCKK